MAPAAPTAQRDGISQATCSRPGDVDLEQDAVKTTWTIANMTSSGMVFSAVFTSAEMTRPNIIEVKPSAMIAQADLHGRRHDQALFGQLARGEADGADDHALEGRDTPRTITFDISTRSGTGRSPVPARRSPVP